MFSDHCPPPIGNILYSKRCNKSGLQANAQSSQPVLYRSWPQNAHGVGLIPVHCGVSTLLSVSRFTAANCGSKIPSQKNEIRLKKSPHSLKSSARKMKKSGCSFHFASANIASQTRQYPRLPWLKQLVLNSQWF